MFKYLLVYVIIPQLHLDTFLTASIYCLADLPSDGHTSYKYIRIYMTILPKFLAGTSYNKLIISKEGHLLLLLLNNDDGKNESFEVYYWV